MINIVKDISRIKDWEDETIYVVTDFDHTITNDFSQSSWAILSKTDSLPKEYTRECYKQYYYYHPIEIDEKIPFDEKNKLMIEWWTAHIGLFVKYKLSEEIVAGASTSRMPFREGAKEFLADLNRRKIPVIIISAGVGNFIEQVLYDNDCYYDNICLVSNFLEFKDGTAVGISNEIVHSLNKNTVSLPPKFEEMLKNRNNAILLGDFIYDINMVPDDRRDNALKIGFYVDDRINYKMFSDSFDVVCTDNAGYNEIVKKLDL